MKRRDPLKLILTRTRAHWDRNETRPTVRWAFAKALQCRTAELGAEVYASDLEERNVYHTCKSPACSSCGYRATAQWQRGWWAALPEASYKGITLTMPDVLWKIFRENPILAKALPLLAAKVIQARANAKYGLHVGVIAVLHTFNGKLEFNAHVHTMVSAGGLARFSGTWISSVYYDRNCLMKAWRRAVIALLRAALRADRLRKTLTAVQMEQLLAVQESRWWSINIQSFASREHFLRYAGRYVRRPPIALRRITYVGNENIRFWYKDKKLRRQVAVQCSLEEFSDRWAQHLRERYGHASRSFGLFAPPRAEANIGCDFCNFGPRTQVTAHGQKVGGFHQT